MLILNKFAVKSRNFAAIILTILIAPTVECATLTPKFVNHYDLVALGLQVLDLQAPLAQREAAFQEYLASPMMRIAFKRYSDPSRPPENRVDRSLFEDFIRKLWRHDYEAIKNPRMQFILPQYRWGLAHRELIVKDLALVQRHNEEWLATARQKIPWGTPAASDSAKPIHIVYLFDPGGSFPWAEEDAEGKYIFIDIVQARGLTDSERDGGIDVKTFSGFMAHELFHLFQNDRGNFSDPLGFLLKIAVAEGSACLIGNNAPDSRGHKYFPNEASYFTSTIQREWLERIAKNPNRIHDFVALIKSWKKNTPNEAEASKIMTRDGWVAGPTNGLYMGDVYRVGAEMLLQIRETLGTAAFYEVVGDSGRLLERWEQASKSSAPPKN